ncbi:Gtp-binding protein engb [Thalictrum thalictroides]|uniref:Gtp-binding protein engb n=1 Tax=Thalictrum thalictroides TaxID=46969 RepID=A0A7J6WB76_THATH|nr:Gtp-binding protein engb [Thalictrum thalictroides]
MSEVKTSKNKFNEKVKFEVGKVKFSKKRSEEPSKFKVNDDGFSEKGSFKKSFKLNSRDDNDGKRGYGVESSGMKRKRVYGERGVEKSGEFDNGGVPNRKFMPRDGRNDKEGFVRRKSSGKDAISDVDRLNRAKFSSSRGGNSQRDEFSKDRGSKKEFRSSRGYKGRADVGDGKRSFSRGKEKGGNEEGFEFSKERGRKKEFESSRGYNGRADVVDGKRSIGRAKERVGSEEGFGSKLKSNIKTRDMRPPRVITRGEGASPKHVEGSDSNPKSQTKGRDRLPSSKRDEASDNQLKTKNKTRDKWVSTKHDDVESGSQKQQSKTKTDSNRQVDQRPGNRPEVGPLETTTKKLLRPKKYKEENSLEDCPPRNRKKIKMRIDPDDISNKKRDDGISIIGKTVEKKVDPDKDNELSQNAQFRAIQPSPSILSFVEDNLLGRRRLIDLRRAGYNIDLSAPLDNIPLSTSTERERIEEAVFRNKLEFFAAAKVSSSFPPAELPEIAFAGRSNVGKSSLLNALTRQWGVVRTSDKPGLTQTINFFKLGSKLCMVDLPGYGFAYAKEEVKDAWEELVKEYVSSRVGLKRVCLLIDTKWGMKPRDHELINLMERSQTKYQVVLTKSDLVFPIDVARRAMQIEEVDSQGKYIYSKASDDDKFKVWWWNPKPKNSSFPDCSFCKNVEEVRQTPDSPTREDLVDALDQVKEGRIPENRFALRILAEEMINWPNLEVKEGRIPENRFALRILAEEMINWPNLEVEIKKSKPKRSQYAKATDTGVDPQVAAKRLNIEWDAAAEIEDSDESDDSEVPSAVGYGALYLVTAFPVIIGISVVLILFYNSLQ